MPLEMVFSYQ